MMLPKRKSTRLKDYDYSQNGGYFVTICCHNKQCIFSHIVGEGSPLPQLTAKGKIAQKVILSINEKYPQISVDKFVIMPNHIHVIFIIQNNGRGDPSPTIIDAVGFAKYNITKQINQKHGASEKIFQRSFHDHIIRDERDYLKIWNYIDTNPAKWSEDCFYTE